MISYYVVYYGVYTVYIEYNEYYSLSTLLSIYFFKKKYLAMCLHFIYIWNHVLYTPVLYTVQCTSNTIWWLITLWVSIKVKFMQVVLNLLNTYICSMCESSISERPYRLRSISGSMCVEAWFLISFRHFNHQNRDHRLLKHRFINLMIGLTI